MGSEMCIRDRFDIMDINMGCPVPKVVKNGEGSALMKNPKLAHEIISAMVKAIRKPVTVKIRKGFDDNLSLIHISEPTRRTPISYAVFCLKKKKTEIITIITVSYTHLN